MIEQSVTHVLIFSSSALPILIDHPHTETAGLNSLAPTLTMDGGRITACTLNQSAPAAHPTLRTHHVLFVVTFSHPYISLMRWSDSP
jgi:hypothetical protein